MVRIKKNILPFIIGFVVGCASLIAILVVGLYSYYYFYLKPLMRESLADVRPPEFFLEIPADYSLKFQDLLGNEHTLKEYVNKVIVLNFWATWCSPCVAELPSLGRLAENFKNDPNVVVLCISKEERDVISLKQKSGKIEASLYSAERQNIPSIYKTPSIPVTFIISPRGKIVQKHVGSAKWDDKSVVDYIESLRKLSQKTN